MSAFMTDEAMRQVAVGTLNLSTDTFKWMLCTSGYTPSKTDSAVTGPAASEIAATNYAGGFGGAGRKSAPRTVVKDTGANVVRVVFSGNAVWSALGGATNATVATAVLIKEVANDAGSLVVAAFQLASAVTTNGSDYTLTVDGSNGNLTFAL